MGSKKKDLEIIYNLQWKNKSGNGGDKANIIGMYDIPATTLNWDIFKSYLLKNSGTVGDDVKVSYITDSNREFPIESQTDFQIALYAFRRKARTGDIVNLKLDRISDQQQTSQRSSRHSNDVETQFDTEAVSIASSCCNNTDSPPEWFVEYMTKFKKNISEEITSAVSNAVSNIKPHTVSQPSCYHSRKSKPESSKRRKLPLLTGDGPHDMSKDYIKSLKLDGKLEQKIEKIEGKSKKSKDKKVALFSKSSDSDVTPSVKRRTSAPCETEDGLLQMDATPVNTQEMIPHMLGGEIYLHQWKVMNSGKGPWTSDTVLMFTWGSKALRPLDSIASVPNLKPGETGTIAVRLQIPNYPGQYECYFHFHHKGRRFGHWLGCQVIVDAFDLKGNKSVLETSYLAPFDASPRNSSAAVNVYNIDNPVTQYGDIWQGTSVSTDSHTYSHSTNKVELLKKSDLLNEQGDASGIAMDKVVRELNSRVEDLKLQDPTDTNCSSDSDNQSIISLSESSSSKGLPSEFVVVPIPDCFQLDGRVPPKSVEADVKPDNSEELSKPSSSSSIAKEKSLENFDDNNNEDTEQNAEKDKDVFQDAISDTVNKSDIVMVTLPEKSQDNEEYACVMVDGHKVMIPKKMIKSEYLPNSKTPEPSVSEKNSRSGSCSPFTEVSIEKDSPSDVKAEKPEVAELLPEASQCEENDFSSHCSAAGSCYSEVTERHKRLFIFPQECPGYEVLKGGEEATPEFCGYTWSTSESHYAFSSESKDILKPTLSHPLVSNPINVPAAQASSSNPFTADTINHVPNYQQTPPEERKAPSEQEIKAAFGLENEFIPPPEEPVRSNSPPRHEPAPEPSAPAPDRQPEGAHAPPLVHILPESLVNGAVNAVSSVARSVINRIVPQGQPGRWVNGHWVSTNPDSTREANLQALGEMGFWNRDLNATLLARYEDDLSRVVAELVQ